MGSPCELKLSGDSALCRGVAADCQREAGRFETRYSRFTTDSITAQINAGAGGAVVPIDAECRAILEYAGVCWSLSDGLFDITSGVLRRVWTKDRLQLPAPDELRPILALIDWQKVELSEAGVRLGMSGMEIDLGGVVKEYAADALAQRIGLAGIDSGVVNLGGDIFCVGTNPEGLPWRIGIKNPDGPGAIAQVGIANAGLATSGGYERYFEIGGKRVSHLLNPATGMPVESLASVSVIADQSVVAGSIATIALLKGQADGLAWLRALACDFLAIDASGQCFTRPGQGLDGIAASGPDQKFIRLTDNRSIQDAFQ
ncbi:MAG: FAD:protein FMN transferase [Pseudomonadales bacterium]|nr:FAD:protein FMN transferase [Pseudomonadales bacterium]